MAQREFEIIRQYFRDSGLGFEKSGIALGIGDDCALLNPPVDQQIAISLDLLQEGVHFPAGAVADLVAYRALAVNLSDLAAIGAEPWCFTLGLSMPDAEPLWLEAFSRGLLELAKLHNCPLVGGDLIRGSLHIAIQVQGLVPAGKALRRSTAKAGDLIYVTGTLGDAAIALAILQAVDGTASPLLSATAIRKLSNSQRDFFIRRFYQPDVRLAAGIALRDYASACIDISDGLLNDLAHIVEDSGVGAELDIEQLPYSVAMQQCVEAEHRLSAALFGGDDYELCFTVAPEQCNAMEKSLVALNLTVKRVGEIVSKPGIRCLDSLGDEVKISGQAFRHFAEATQ